MFPFRIYGFGDAVRTAMEMASRFQDFMFYDQPGPTRTDGGGPWNYKPIRRHRKLKKYRRNAGRR